MNAILYVDRTGVQWALPPARLPSASERLRLLRQVAEGRCLRPAQRPPAGAGPPAGRPRSHPVRRRDRRTEREDLHQCPHAKSGHRRGQKERRPQAKPHH
ncbi:hypothetical protein [Streptomyces turgidiscabies]|uniref:hypothetical protein n=1 Tax=Streptomyces turgidiscabies TaxID=85558 RepID=UPI0027D92052|nr:hypothetical protein [Streptomyces turgidiscabies]